MIFFISTTAVEQVRRFDYVYGEQRLLGWRHLERRYRRRPERGPDLSR